MSKEKPKVGQIIYSVNMGNAARYSPKVLTEYEVVKVGRKYFSIEKADGQGWPIQFRLDTWQQNTEYSSDHNLYETREEYELEKEYEIKFDRIGEYFKPNYTRDRDLPMPGIEKIRAIMAILEPEE